VLGDALTVRCKRPAEDLLAYLNGSLEEDARAELEAHIAGCALCGQRLERFSTMSSLVEQHAAPPSLPRLARPEPPPQPPWPSRPADVVPLPPAPARRRGCLRPWAFGLLVLALGVVWLERSPGTTQG
jgi:anti-sigma factor RsiW